MTAIRARCRTCRNYVTTPADEVRYCPVEGQSRIRIDCPDCPGVQTKAVPLDFLGELVVAGMHDSFDERDVIAFQVAMAAHRDNFCPAEIIEREGVNR